MFGKLRLSNFSLGGRTPRYPCVAISHAMHAKDAQANQLPNKILADHLIIQKLFDDFYTDDKLLQHVCAGWHVYLGTLSASGIF